MPRIIFQEHTPNPNARKLVMDVKVCDGSLHADQRELLAGTFAERFFDIHGVEAVFLMENFITINKSVTGVWEYILMQIEEYLKDLVDLQPVVGEKTGSAVTVARMLSEEEFESLSTDGKIRHIDALFDEELRPGLARDGGGIKIASLEGDLLSIDYQGACGSCSSSLHGTLNYINRLLQDRVHSGLTVIPTNAQDSF